MNLATSLAEIRNATLAARAADKSPELGMIATRAEAGQIQVIRNIKVGRNWEARPMSNWLPMSSAVAFLRGLAP